MLVLVVSTAVLIDADGVVDVVTTVVVVVNLVVVVLVVKLVVLVLLDDVTALEVLLEEVTLVEAAVDVVRVSRVKERATLSVDVPPATPRDASARHCITALGK